jgi:O-antigen/teichoic acid export membrane protein
LIIGYAKIEILFAAVLSIGLFAAAQSFFVFYGDYFRLLLKISAGILFLFSFRNILLVIFGGFSHFKALSIYQAFESFARFIFVVLIVGVYKIGAVGAILSTLFSMLATIVIIGLPLWFRLAKNFKGVAAAKESLYKKTLLSHGKFQILSQPLKTLFDGMRSWIITLLAGLEALAIFQVAFQIYSYINMFLGAIEAVMMPIFSEELSRGTDMAKKIFTRVTKYTGWLSIVTIVFSWVFISPIFALLFGIKYASSIPLVMLMALALPFDGFGVILRPALFGIKAQKFLFKAAFYILITAVPFASVLTYFYGVLGFAVAAPLGSLLTFILRYKYLIKERPDLKFNFWSLFLIDIYDKELLSRIWRRISLNLIKLSRHE